MDAASSSAPVAPPPSIDQILERAELRGEETVNRIRVALALLLFAMLGAAGSANTEAANRLMAATCAVWLGYAAWHAWFLRGPGERRAPWLKYLSCSVDLLVVGAGYFAAAANHSGVMEYWRSQTLVVFALWNLLSGLRLSPRVSVYSAALTAAINGGLLVHTAVAGGVELRVESVYTLEAVNVADQVVTILFVSIPGLVAALIARRARDLVTRAELESHRRAEVEHHRDQLGKFLPRQLVEEMLRTPGDALLGGERRVATIVFVDLRDFTPIAERSDPEALVEFLNTWFSRMVAVVFHHRGTLDKFLGDGFMALFGVPVELGDEPGRAVATAVNLLKAADALRAELKGRGFGELRIGVGVATGPVLCGNIGTRDRMEFTCIGDTVNLASRLEKLNRELGTGVLLCERTAAAIDGALALEELPPQKVRGKRGPVRVFTLDPAGVDEAALRRLDPGAEPTGPARGL